MSFAKHLKERKEVYEFPSLVTQEFLSAHQFNTAITTQPWYYQHKWHTDNSLHKAVALKQETKCIWIYYIRKSRKYSTIYMGQVLTGWAQHRNFIWMPHLPDASTNAKHAHYIDLPTSVLKKKCHLHTHLNLGSYSAFLVFVLLFPLGGFTIIPNSMTAMGMIVPT